MKVISADIADHIKQHPWINAVDLAAHFWVTTRTIYRHLDLLIIQNEIIKRGKVPQVRYYVHTKPKNTDVHFSPEITRALHSEWYQISKTWEELIWTEWFITRCKKRKNEPIDAAKRWHKHIRYIDNITTPHGIDAIKKLKWYGNDVLTNFWYGSIYALPEFGKTKPWTWMEIAKTHPSNKVFDKLIELINPYFQHIIHDFSIDWLCFAQPTAKRPKQIMNYLEKVLARDLPVLPLYKVPGFFPPQKTLRKREERIANAQVSFAFKEIQMKKPYSHVLIVDDAVWSGATLVEIWRKILQNNYAKKVSALSITGTANGIFDEFKHFEVLANV